MHVLNSSIVCTARPTILFHLAGNTEKPTASRNLRVQVTQLVKGDSKYPKKDCYQIDLFCVFTAMGNITGLH